MGFEYRIRFVVPAGMTKESIGRKLPDPTIPNSTWVAYDYTLDDEGIYFLDHGRSDASSIAFRRLVDEALGHGERVVVEAI